MIGSTLKVATNPQVPKGQCAVLVDGEAIYIGRIGKPAIPFILQPGALLILNPIDFADGEEFMKKQLN